MVGEQKCVSGWGKIAANGCAAGGAHGSDGTERKSTVKQAAMDSERAGAAQSPASTSDRNVSWPPDYPFIYRFLCAPPLGSLLIDFRLYERTRVLSSLGLVVK